MSDESCPKCGGQMIGGTAGVSALRLWFRPDESHARHVSFKLTSAHADIVAAKARTGCGYAEFYIDPVYLKELTS